MTDLLTDSEIEELLNDVSSSFKDYPTCPKCNHKTKRVLIKQRFAQKTFVEIINEQDYKKYNGVVINGQCICLKCQTVYFT